MTKKLHRQVSSLIRADCSVITLVGPTSTDGFTTNIVVTRELLVEPSVEIFADQQLRLLANTKEIDQLEMLDEQITTIGDAPAFQWVYMLHIKGKRVQQAQTYIVQNMDAATTGFVITCSASAADFAAHSSTFHSFTQQFRFCNA